MTDPAPAAPAAKPFSVVTPPPADSLTDLSAAIDAAANSGDARPDDLPVVVAAPADPAATTAPSADDGRFVDVADDLGDDDETDAGDHDDLGDDDETDAGDHDDLGDDDETDDEVVETVPSKSSSEASPARRWRDEQEAQAAVWRNRRPPVEPTVRKPSTDERPYGPLVNEPWYAKPADQPATSKVSAPTPATSNPNSGKGKGGDGAPPSDKKPWTPTRMILVGCGLLFAIALGVYLMCGAYGGWHHIFHGDGNFVSPAIIVAKPDATPTPPAPTVVASTPPTTPVPPVTAPAPTPTVPVVPPTVQVPNPVAPVAPSAPAPTVVLPTQPIAPTQPLNPAATTVDGKVIEELRANDGVLAANANDIEERVTSLEEFRSNVEQAAKNGVSPTVPTVSSVQAQASADDPDLVSFRKDAEFWGVAGADMRKQYEASVRRKAVRLTSKFNRQRLEDEAALRIGTNGSAKEFLNNIGIK